MASRGRRTRHRYQASNSAVHTDLSRPSVLLVSLPTIHSETVETIGGADRSDDSS